MSDQDLRILIQTELEKVTWKKVNDQLEELKKKYESSGIKIKIDDETMRVLQDFGKSMEKVQSILKEQRRTVEQTQDVFKGLDGTIKTVTRTVDAMGEVVTKTKTVHDANKKAMQDETLAATKLTDAIEKQNKANVDSITAIKNRAGAITGFNIKSSQGYTITSTNLEADGMTLKSARVTTNYKKEREDELKAQEDANKKAEALDKAHYQAIQEYNSMLESAEKQHYLALQQNAKREDDYVKQKTDLITKIQDAQRRYAGDKNLVGNLENLLGSAQQITSIGNYKKAIGEVDSQLKQYITTANSARSNSISFGEALRTALEKFPVWMLATTAFYAPIRALESGIQTVNELNKSLTDISIVTGQSQQQVAGLAKEFASLGDSMKVPMSELAAVAADINRQGITDNDAVIQRMKDIVTYAKISSLSIKDSNEILTATINSMGVSAQKASDTWSALGDATATGADEIGKAFQKLGGSASALHIPFEFASALIANLSSKTRESAETIGDSLKSLMSRFEQLREKGFTEDDNTKVSEVAKSLNAVGIALMDQQGNFRNYMDVLKDLSNVWPNLTNRQQAYVATSLAG
jgi:TP901 family phage tail tape measure protein